MGHKPDMNGATPSHLCRLSCVSRALVHRPLVLLSKQRILAAPLLAKKPCKMKQIDDVLR